MVNKSKYENLNICKVCGGACCKSAGCIISVKQFKEFNKEVLKKILDTNIVTIDWWEGDPRPEKEQVGEFIGQGYYLRIREVNDDDKVVGSWGGQCILHRKYGKCPFEFEYRPYEAAYMIPNPDRISKDLAIRHNASCGLNDEYTKNSIACEYVPYYDDFEDVIYEDKEIRKSFVDFPDIEEGVKKYLEIIQKNITVE